MVIAIDNFFGCYLLHCTNPKYKGRTYIGFTVNPERRIAQHNAGKHKGGAWKTSGKGPWDMALILHGFPSDIAALRFEWAWQNPRRSRRLKNIQPKLRKESNFQYRVRVAATMLSTTPWKRLPITVRWLKQEYAMELDPLPPQHMPIAYGPVTAKVKRHKTVPNSKTTDQEISEPPVNLNPEPTCTSINANEYVSLMDRLTATKTDNFSEMKVSSKAKQCSLCLKLISDENILNCISESCTMCSHMICLSRHFLANEPPFQLLPVEAPCPSCHISLLWGDLIRNSQGFRQYLGNKTYADI